MKVLEKYFKYRSMWLFGGAFDEEHQLTSESCAALLKKGGLFVRNAFKFDCQEKTNFWYIICDKFLDLEKLSHNTRKKVRASLRKLEFQLVDLETLSCEGFPLVEKAFSSYKIKERSMSKNDFNTFVDHCKEFHYDIWGIFDRESLNMIGFCCVRVWDDACDYDFSVIDPAFLRQNTSYPYYGLYHELTRHYLCERHFRYVSAGSRTMTEHSHIQDFLEEKFGFRRAYSHLHVTTKWWLRVAIFLLKPFRKILPCKKLQAVVRLLDCSE